VPAGFSPWDRGSVSFMKAVTITQPGGPEVFPVTGKFSSK
jgi:hypothetical protein